MRLQPLRYEYEPNNAMGLNSVGERIGLGAHAVQQVMQRQLQRMPRVCLMVDNDPIIWTMLNAIKEPTEEIVELKRQIQHLRSTTRRRQR